MSVVVILLVFIIALAVTVTAGGARAFVLVYIPALLMLNQLPEVPIPHAPLNAYWSALYGIFLGLLFKREPLKFRLCTVDVIMVLLLISVTITAWSTEVIETGINSFRTDLLQWILPYFLARIVFRSVEIRRLALNTMVVLIAMISVCALIEFRLYPYWYLHMLHNLGMNNPIAAMAYHRYGFNRVGGTVSHPIYFGNLCVALFGMVAVLARTSGLKLSNIWVTLALLGALGCIITSISFTPYVGVAAGFGFFLVLMAMPIARKLLLPGVLLVIAGGTAATYYVAQQPLGTRPDDDFGASLYIRHMIVMESWEKAVAAGPFGYGLRHDFTKDNDTDVNFDLSSIDNSYMQLTMTRGWIYTGLWLSIAVFFSGRMTIAFSRVKHKSQVFPLAVCTATVLGLMVSMYTVWAGGLYTVFWLLMLGLANTLIDLVLHPEMRTLTVEPSGAMPTVTSLSPGRPMGPAYGSAAALAVNSARPAIMQRTV